MLKKFCIAWLILFIVWMAGSFVVHAVLLNKDYKALPQLFRPEEEAAKYGMLMFVAHVLMSGALVWIYSNAAEAKPWLPQGLRFGIAIALLTVVPMYMIYYVVQPMPGSVVIKQILFDGILVVVLGIIVAFLYRRPAIV